MAQCMWCGNIQCANEKQYIFDRIWCVCVCLSSFNRAETVTCNLQHDLQSDTFQKARASVELGFDATHARCIHFVTLNITRNVCMCYLWLIWSYLYCFIVLCCLM